MSCVLRISGVGLDADALARGTSLHVYRVDRKGEPRRPLRTLFERSAVHIDVSEASFDQLPLQIGDAVAFLRAHVEALRAAVQFPGVDIASLDFAVWTKDVAIDSKQLPPELLKLAGEVGIGIELSIYPRPPVEHANGAGSGET